MRFEGAFAAVVLALCVVSRGGWAAPCEGARLDRGTPIQAPSGPAGFGVLPEACSGTDVAIKGAVALLVAEEDFYGYLTAGVSVVARYALPGGDWVSLETPSLDYWYSANATVEASTVEAGPGSLGYHLALPALWGMKAAPYVKLLLPTDTVYHRGRRYGFAHGVSSVWEIAPRFELVGGVTFPTFIVHNSGSAHVAQLSEAALDISFEAFSFSSVAAGLAVRVRSGDVPGFESLDPRLGLRFHPYQQLYVNVALAAPMLGDDRTDLAGTLLVGWRFP